MGRKDKSNEIRCGECSGTGWILKKYLNKMGGYIHKTERCRICKGTGKL